jgi:hypothetical protein
MIQFESRTWKEVYALNWSTMRSTKQIVSAGTLSLSDILNGFVLCGWIFFWLNYSSTCRDLYRDGKMKLLILRSNVGYQEKRRRRKQNLHRISSSEDFHVCMSLMIFNFSLFLLLRNFFFFKVLT